VNVELGGAGCCLKRLERRCRRDARLGRAEEGDRPSFDPDVNDGGGRKGCHREGRSKHGDDNEGTAKHVESSFREGFGFRGERQVF